MQSDNLESFLNYCNSLRNVYIRWIADPDASNNPMLEFTLGQFIRVCGDFLEMESFKAHAERPACKLLQELYEKIIEFDEISYIDFKDPRWITIQDLARKTEKALTTLIEEQRPHG
ncbi:MAG TPA: hypothetical protein VIJ46_05880 [Rhabdochlamydiaceae bacterium]